MWLMAKMFIRILWKVLAKLLSPTALWLPLLSAYATEASGSCTLERREWGLVTVSETSTYSLTTESVSWMMSDCGVCNAYQSTVLCVPRNFRT